MSKNPEHLLPRLKCTFDHPNRDTSIPTNGYQHSEHMAVDQTARVRLNLQL